MSGNWSSKPIFHSKDVIALARMETPVIYFYSQRERNADVSVLFRGGNPDRVVSARRRGSNRRQSP